MQPDDNTPRRITGTGIVFILIEMTFGLAMLGSWIGTGFVNWTQWVSAVTAFGCAVVIGVRESSR